MPQRLHALQEVSSIARASWGGGVLAGRALLGGVLVGEGADRWRGGTGWRGPQDGALALSGVSPSDASITLLSSCTSALLILFRGVFFPACSASSLAFFLLLCSRLQHLLLFPPLALATTISTALPTSLSSSTSCTLPSATTRPPITPDRSSMASSVSSCAASLGESHEDQKSGQNIHLRDCTEQEPV